MDWHILTAGSTTSCYHGVPVHICREAASSTRREVSEIVLSAYRLKPGRGAAARGHTGGVQSTGRCRYPKAAMKGTVKITQHIPRYTCIVGEHTHQYNSLLLLQGPMLDSGRWILTKGIEPLASLSSWWVPRCALWTWWKRWSVIQ